MVEKDGKYEKTGESISSFDFTKYQTVLEGAGKGNGLELVNVNVKAVNIDTDEEIDFGSFSDFNTGSIGELEVGSLYQFHLQGVYKMVGEHVDEDEILTDFTATGEIYGLMVNR